MIKHNLLKIVEGYCMITSYTYSNKQYREMFTHSLFKIRTYTKINLIVCKSKVMIECCTINKTLYNNLSLKCTYSSFILI